MPMVPICTPCSPDWASPAPPAAALRTRSLPCARNWSELANSCDLILTTGGVSAGRLDLVPDVVRALGGEILFHKVAIRPGKPILYARLPGGKHLFGLPGNPLAVAVGMRFFVIPALRAMQGMAAEVFTPAICSEAVRSRGKLRFFAKAHRSVDQRSAQPGRDPARTGVIPDRCIAEGQLLGRDSGRTTTLPAGSTVLTAPLYPDP